MTRISATLSLVSCIASIAAGAALAPSKSALGGKYVFSQTIETGQGLKQATGEEKVGLEAVFRDIIVEANAEEPFALQKLDIEVYMGISAEERQYGFNCEIDLSGSRYQEPVKSFALFHPSDDELNDFFFTDSYRGWGDVISLPSGE